MIGRAQFAAGAIEDILVGGGRLRSTFRQQPIGVADPGGRLAASADSEVALIRSGFAYRSCVLANGRRAIVDILCPGDIAGLDHILMTRPGDEFVAASRLRYQVISAPELRRLMAETPVALYLYALLAEARFRVTRLAIAIGRLEARARICVMVLDIYDRLRRRDLVGRPTFNLPLTQEQIADHLGLTYVHVSRTLRRLRDERLLLIDRQVVIVYDLERLRAVVEGLPEMPGPPEAIASAASTSLTAGAIELLRSD